VDIGRDHDLTVIWVIEKSGDVRSGVPLRRDPPPTDRLQDFLNRSSAPPLEIAASTALKPAFKMLKVEIGLEWQLLSLRGICLAEMSKSVDLILPVGDLLLAR